MNPLYVALFITGAIGGAGVTLIIGGLIWFYGLPKKEDRDWTEPEVGL